MIYLLRVGPFGQVGRFGATNPFDAVHGEKIICRTARGLEIAEFLNCYDEDGEAGDVSLDGEVLRTLSEQDQLLAERLDRNRLEAIDECQKLIDDQGLSVAILDAELTFDGRNLYFYFSGDGHSVSDETTAMLAKTFDAQVRFSEFAENLVNGCGPECGTAAAQGCGSGCSSCGLKSTCKSS